MPRRVKDSGILLPDGPGDAPMRCNCCLIPRKMERRLNGPDSVVVFCPASRNAWVIKNGLLRPMPGIYSGNDVGKTLWLVDGRRLYEKRVAA